jgi:hypothetical protein
MHYGRNVVDRAVFAVQVALVCHDHGPQDGILLPEEDGPDAERGKVKKR